MHKCPLQNTSIQMWRKNIKTSTDYVIINIQKSIDTKQNRLYDRALNIK